METKKENCLTTEAVLIQSVLCSKKSILKAHSKTILKNKKCHSVQFIPDNSSITIKGTLIKDLVVLQGSILGSLIVNGKHQKNITLFFQEEVTCEGACPGDSLKLTDPFVEAIIPPQVVSDGYHDVVVLKVILVVQTTVIREKIGKINVTILGDVNENRCKTPPTTPSVIHCHTNDHHHKEHALLTLEDYEELDEDFTCVEEEFKD
ncbi:hypothetical protein [Bacillus weihaiensis]|uniref:SipL SPOCS domain-containing protein n=1 Tax=Bacillus weihaiensis TaxID=1547283 RepID=A0A1L3MPL1_9BACI|nr:hypothetical protein [Bacillus weihaiensis]APH04280.1 hypothetical protein A9C19_05725 [Bacillus weihaiensis]